MLIEVTSLNSPTLKNIYFNVC